MHDRDIDLHLLFLIVDGRLGDEGLRLMHLVPAPAVRLSCKDECYPDQALTVYWLKDNMRLVCHSSLSQFSSFARRKGDEKRITLADSLADSSLFTSAPRKEGKGKKRTGMRFQELVTSHPPP